MRTTCFSRLLVKNTIVSTVKRRQHSFPRSGEEGCHILLRQVCEQAFPVPFGLFRRSHDVPSVFSFLRCSDELQPLSVSSILPVGDTTQIDMRLLRSGNGPALRVGLRGGIRPRPGAFVPCFLSPGVARQHQPRPVHPRWVNPTRLPQLPTHVLGALEVLFASDHPGDDAVRAEVIPVQCDTDTPHRPLLGGEASVARKTVVSG